MRQIVSSLAFAGLLLSAGPSFAKAQQQQQSQQQVASASPAEQVICETEEETGSRLASHKICHTRSQWDQLRRDDRSAVERAQQQRSMSANPGG